MFSDGQMVMFLKQLLGGDMRLTEAAMAISGPGAAYQHWHRDEHMPYGLEHSGATPSQSVTMVVPTVNVSKVNGPTEFTIGSHIPPMSAAGLHDWWPHSFVRGPPSCLTCPVCLCRLPTTAPELVIGDAGAADWLYCVLPLLPSCSCILIHSRAVPP
jgi:hypothetical protein